MYRVQMDPMDGPYFPSCVLFLCAEHTLLSAEAVLLLCIA